MATVIDTLLIRLGFDTDESGAASFETGLGKIIKTAGKVAAVVGTVATGVGALTVNTAASFEEAMNAISAVSGTTGDEFDDLRNKAQELGAATAFSATEAANGMEFLAKAGLDTNQILSAIPNTLALASAGGIDLATSADILSNIMSGMGIAANESGRAADVLSKAASSSNVDINMLGETMKYVAPIAKQLGVTLEEASAIIGVLGNAGIQASTAGTSLRSMFTRFNTHSGAKKAFDELGISLQDANGDMRSMIDVMHDLSIATDGMDAEVKLDFFKDMAGVEAMSALAVAVDAAADGSLVNLKDKLEGASGAAEEMAGIRMQGFNGEMKTLKSVVEGLILDIADTGILYLATQGVKLLASLVRGLVFVLESVKSVFGALASVFRFFMDIAISMFQYLSDNSESLIKALKVIAVIVSIITLSLGLMYKSAVISFAVMQWAALKAFAVMTAGWFAVQMAALRHFIIVRFFIISMQWTAIRAFLLMKAAAIASAIATGAAWLVAFAPFLLMGIAIAAAIAAMWYLFKNWSEIWARIKSGAQIVLDYISDALSPIIDSVKWLLDKIPGISFDDEETESTVTVNREWGDDVDSDDINLSANNPNGKWEGSTGYGNGQNIDYGADTNNQSKVVIDYGDKPNIDYSSVVSNVSEMAISYSEKALDYSNKALATSPNTTKSMSSNVIDYSKHSVNTNHNNQASSTVTQTINVSSAKEAAIIADRTAQGARYQTNGYQ